MVGKAFSAVIKLDYVIDSPKTILFTPGKDKLAKYMVCMTRFLQTPTLNPKLLASHLCNNSFNKVPFIPI